MYKPIYIFIGLRYLWNPHLPNFKKIITILSILGISIGISSTIVTISIINGFQNKFKNEILSFIPHIIITNKNRNVNKLDFPKEILKLKNVKKITNFISKKVIIEDKKEINIGEIIGIKTKNKKILENYNIKNVLYTLNSREYHAIIGKELAKKLHVNINDKIKLIVLPTSKKKFLKNRLNIQLFKITGVFSTNNEIDEYQILINEKNALNFLNYDQSSVTGWRIWLKDPFTLDIQKIKKLNKNFIVLDWKMKKGELFKAMQIENYIMLFFFILILLVAGFNIVISLTIHVLDKKNNISVFQSQGLPRYKIMLIFIVLGSSISIIGNLFGTIISIILIFQKDFLNFLINIFFIDIKIPIKIIPIQIFIINITSIFLTILSTLYPIWYAIKSMPSRILSDE
ncbi:FtsX-like permease family protein [Buchnera aphidicola (Rhopalosiphum padi)]|uniref:FtsX-like permease family protein n=1 Tax=Buchnera aphidicola subsp. Rhopalosiphum padi TaxID=98793 RepID=A0A4D6Y997_BUCRP|nr:ABC transporter permease [Buchnera aphidicola]QCI24933.1 FtsX-like permease family protein [Buchnera aphidicola (Rhopalosiphum padi)]